MVKIKKETVEIPTKKNNKFTIIGISLVAVGIVATLFIFPPNKEDDKPTQPSSSKVTKKTSSSKKEVTADNIQEVEAILSSEAKATEKPFDLELESIGGGYVFSETIYHKNDKDRQQKVTVITPPDTPQEQTTAQDALMIRDKLISDVKGNVVVINGKETHLLPGEILFEVYETNNDNQPFTIVMFLNNIAFGYVEVSKDLSLKPVFVSNIADFEDHSQGNAPVAPPPGWQGS